MKKGCFFSMCILMMMMLMLLIWLCPKLLQGQTTGTLVLSEDFTDTIFPPPGWSATGVTRVTTSGSWHSPPAAASIGTHAGTLSLPPVPHPVLLSFQLGRTTSTVTKMLLVEVSFDGDPATFQPVDTFDHDNTNANGFTFVVTDLSAFSHIPTVWIRLRKVSATTSPWRIDDIEVYATSVLPVELYAFRGTMLSDGNVDLWWSTASETGNAEFTILRGCPQGLFEPMASVAGAGNSTATTHYRLPDKEPHRPVSYYRLIQTNIDGTTAILRTISVTTAMPAPFRIERVNSVAGGLEIELSGDIPGQFSITLYDINGRTLHSLCCPAPGEKKVVLGVKPLPGVYVLHVSDSIHRVTRKFSVDL